MSVELLAVLAGLVGAFGGSIGGQALAISPQRRTARAGAFKALDAVENDRFVYYMPVFGQRLPFRQSIREFRATSLVAGLPSESVRVYSILAEVAFQCSLDYKRFRAPQPDADGWAGGVEVDWDDLVADAASHLRLLMLRPWIARFRSAKSGVQELEARGGGLVMDNPVLASRLNVARRKYVA